MSSDYHVIIGLGKTGLSCAHFFLKNKLPFVMMDTRVNPPHLDAFKILAPDAPLYLGGLDKAILSRAKEIILSPGLSVHHPVIAELMAQGKSVIGDVELFARRALAPIIAVTGSNGKSTVVSMLQAMAAAAGVHAALGGNIGVPVLDLLENPVPDYYILELSSFQLMSTLSLRPCVAVILNLSENHLDHHTDMNEYRQAKMKVYQACEKAVCNRDDGSLFVNNGSIPHFYFTAGVPAEGEYGLRVQDGRKYLAWGSEYLLPVAALREVGQHFYMNALAALAIGESLAWSRLAMLSALKKFQGLPHRCRLVQKQGAVSWYNDSKGTTVVATLAAVRSLRAELPGNLVLILGGVGKGADFLPLVEGMVGLVAHTILMGESAPQLAELLYNKVPFSRAESLQDAVLQAKEKVGSCGFVLFSPACASYDMFKNFEHRGNEFIRLVEELY